MSVKAIGGRASRKMGRGGGSDRPEGSGAVVDLTNLEESKARERRKIFGGKVIAREKDKAK